MRGITHFQNIGPKALVSRVSAQRGFTLLEILIALAIFAYAASAIVKLVGQSANNINQVEKMTFASWVASNRLAELQAEANWPPKNNHKGEVKMAGNIWYWRQQVTKTEDDNLRSVNVQVSLDKAFKSNIYDLTTFVSEKPPVPELLGSYP